MRHAPAGECDFPQLFIDSYFVTVCIVVGVCKGSLTERFLRIELTALRFPSGRLINEIRSILYACSIIIFAEIN
jgi:hypothetical protein